MVPGLTILDLSDPDQPVPRGQVETASTVYQVVLDGDRAVVCDLSSALYVIDIVDPDSPQVLGTLPIPEMIVTGLAVDNGYAYVSVQWWGVLIVDISDPANPVQVGIADVIESPSTVLADFPLVYVIDLEGGLEILDVSDPGSPQHIGTYCCPSGGLALRGHLMFVNNGIGLEVVDVSNPQAPVRVGQASVPARGDMKLSGDLLYLAGGETGLHVVDVQDPLAPEYIGAGGTQGNALAVAVSAERVYQAAEFSGLAIFRPHCLESNAVDDPPPGTTAGCRPLEARPNPFLPRTSISFVLDQECRADLAVFDAAGRRIAGLTAGLRPAGRYSATWDGSDASGRPVSPGVYFVRLAAGETVLKNRLMRVRGERAAWSV